MTETEFYRKKARSHRKRRERDHNANMEALVCGLIRYMEGRGLGDDLWLNLDWSEMGVEKIWAVDFWREHKKKDLIRKRAEEAKQLKESLRETALAKLTDGEKNALGLSDRR